MASSLSRRLASKLLLQNPNPSSLPPLFHANAQLRTLSEPKPTNPRPPTLNPTNPSSDLPILSRFPSRKPINPNPWFLRSHTTSNPVFTKHSTSEGKPRSCNPFCNPDSAARRFSSSSPENADPDKPTVTPELQHQEIVGPTVERDVSALANETRRTLESLRRSIYHLSSALALLGVAHLGVGAWIAYSGDPPHEVTIQGLAAFAFPFTLAFLMRRSLKPMSFFQKVEKQGRLQILTLALQVSKSLTLLFLRARVVSICCVVGVSAGSLVILCLRQDSLW